MKERPKAFYPPLLAVFPVLSVYSANQGLMPIEMLWRPLGIVFTAALGVWAVLSGIFRSVDRGAAAAGAGIFSFFFYSRLTDLLPGGPESGTAFWIWLAFALLLIAAFGLRWKWTVPVNVLASFLLVASAGQIVIGAFQAASVEKSAAVRQSKSKGATALGSPDIYYVILDGYGRSDALKRAMGFDNSAFVAALKDRGFYVAEGAHSNYCQTELSIPSSLNMDFIPTLLPEQTATSTSRVPLDGLLNDPAVAHYLKNRGYLWVAVTTGFPPIRFPKADVRLRKGNGSSLLEEVLLQMTPLEASDGEVESMFVNRRERLLGAIDNLKALAGHSSRPRFVTAHILAPHPPFVFGPNGEPVPHHGPFGFWDGSEYIAHVGSRLDYVRGYKAQALYLNNQMLAVIDRLLSAPGPKPIIILQGDHGSKSRLDQDELAKTDVRECFPNLNAFYVPKPIRDRLYPTITPVNSFRIVLNGIFNDRFRLLPDRSWYSPFSTPYDFTDVTGAVTGATDRATTGAANRGMIGGRGSPSPGHVGSRADITAVPSVAPRVGGAASF